MSVTEFFHSTVVSSTNRDGTDVSPDSPPAPSPLRIRPRQYPRVPPRHTKVVVETVGPRLLHWKRDSLKRRLKGEATGP